MEKEEVSKIIPGDKVYVEYTVSEVQEEPGLIYGVIEGRSAECVTLRAVDVARWERGRRFRMGDIVRYKHEDRIRVGLVDDDADGETVKIERIFTKYGTDSSALFIDTVSTKDVVLLLPREEWKNLPEWGEKKAIQERRFRRGDVVRLHVCEPEHDIPWVVEMDEDVYGMVALVGWGGMDGRVSRDNLYRVEVGNK